MTLDEAIAEAKRRWPSHISATRCEEGFAKPLHGICVVGIRYFAFKRDEWTECDFKTIAMGKTYEEAFANADKGGNK